MTRVAPIVCIASFVWLAIGCAESEQTPAAEDGAADASASGGPPEPERYVSEFEAAVRASQTHDIGVSFHETGDLPCALIETSFEGKPAWRAAGAFLDPATLVVPYEVIDQATDIRVWLGGCEEIEMLGVVGVDPSLSVALLALASPPVGISPLEIAPLPEAGGTAGQIAVLMDAPTPCGMAVATCDDCLRVLDVRELNGIGTRLVLDLPYGVAAECSPVLDPQGRLVALTGDDAGGNSTYAFPAWGLGEIEHHDPVPLHAFATRDRSPRELVEQLYHYGRSLRNGDDFEAAAAAFREVLALDPDHWLALHDLGVCERHMGAADAAVARFERSIEIEPRSTEVWFSLGLTRIEGGDPHGSIPAFRRAIELAPRYANAHGMLAVALAETGEIDDAVEAAEHAITLPAGDPTHFHNLCAFYAQLGRSADVARVAQQWTTRFESDPRGWSRLGRVSIELNDFARGANAYRRAVELGMTDARTYGLYVACLARLGRLSEAESLLETALEQHPRAPALLEFQAFIKRERGR